MGKEPSTNYRPPIVTIMGHVDHGKTTLLDTIRKTNVAAGEHGGITQHIGAYQVEFEGKLITFIDTPGHAAFEKMRSRGADAADIVILTVAANDGVKPQTVEAIKHIKRAGKPIIVALTKTDLPDNNLEKVKKELQNHDILIEEYGGNVPVVETAATKGKGIKELLEVISLLWQLNPIAQKPNSPLQAFVVESELDKNRGPVVTVIVQEGTLRIGQKITVDNESFAVRALIDDNGKNIKEAGPGKPVEILGFKKVLEVGSIVSDSIKTSASDLKVPTSIADLIAKAEGAKEMFKVIIKADVVGSLEAIIDGLPAKVLVVASGIGEVNLNDISLGKVASAPILAFNVKVPTDIKNQSDSQKVVIREYKVIYQLLEEMVAVTEGFEEAKEELKITGRAKIVAIFNIEGQKIAGCQVNFGKLKVGDTIHLKHADKVFETEIASIKKFRKEVDIATNGQECGIALTGQIDFREGDILESLGQSQP